MRLAGRKQASICLTSFSKHVPAGTPRSPHEASRSDTQSTRADRCREGGCFARNHFKRSVSARFIAYEASSHRTSPRGSSWVQALPGKFRGNHNPGFDRGNFCPFPGAYLGSHTPGIPGISGSTWEHTHPGAYSGRETRVFPGGRWEPRSQPRSWPRKNPGTGWIPGFSRVVLLGVGRAGCYHYKNTLTPLRFSRIRHV